MELGEQLLALRGQSVLGPEEGGLGVKVSCDWWWGVGGVVRIRIRVDVMGVGG